MTTFERKAEAVAHQAVRIANNYTLDPNLTASEVSDVITDTLINCMQFGPATLEQIPEIIVNVLDQIADGD